MSCQQMMRCLSFGTLVFLLASCKGGEVIPSASTGEITKTHIQTEITLSSSDTPKPSTMMSVTETGTQTWTPTIPPEGYVLRDWREPVEVITPENMNLVEKVGELEFSDSVTNFSWSPDGTKFAINFLPNALFIVDSHTFSTIYQFQGFFSAFSYDGRLLETGGVQYDLTSGEKIPRENVTIRSSQGYLEEVEFSHNGEYVIGVGSEYIHFFSMKPELHSYIFTREYAQPIHGSVSPDGKYIAVIFRYEDYTEIWDAYQRKPIRILKMEGVSGGSKPKFSSDGESLLFLGYGEWEEDQVVFIQKWDYRTGEPLDVQLLHGNGWEIGTTMDISPQSNVAAFGTNEGEIFVIPLRDCNAVKIGINVEESVIRKVAFRPDGKLIATVGGRDDRSIELWGIPSAGENPTNEPTQGKDNNQTIQCPKIPMIVEQPTPEFEVLVR